MAYALRRDYAAASRLNYQSYLWRESLGYLLHPQIPRLKAGARVADIGTGTGIWLLSLAQEPDVQGRVQLDGLDVDLSQCPPSKFVPANISFIEWNALGDLPAHLVGRYDLVHIRLFQINIKYGDPSRLLENLVQMLKPGGWLQWEEVNNTDNAILKADVGTPTPAMDQLVQYIEQGSKSHRGSDDWLVHLPERLQQHGFSDTNMERHHDPPHLLRYFYEMWLTTIEEFTTTGLKDAAQVEKNLALIRQSHHECKQGAVIRRGKLVCLARKVGL